MNEAWGLTPKTCRLIYTAVIRPILAYTVSIWIRATLNETNGAELEVERVQVIALRIMNRAKGVCHLQGYGDWSLEPPPLPKAQ